MYYFHVCTILIVSFSRYHTDMRRLCILLSVFCFCYTQDQNAIDFDNPGNCGTSESNWKPCIERKIADQVFNSCCERFVPPECRGLCIYETNAIEARVVLMHTIQPSRCRLYKYLPAVVHCAAQTHDNAECCRANGIAQIGEQCLQMCQPQSNPRRFWGVKSLRKDLVVCLAKWDQIMQCHQSGLRARKVPKPTV